MIGVSFLPRSPDLAPVGAHQRLRGHFRSNGANALAQARQPIAVDFTVFLIECQLVSSML
jgi:hypothetical protein